ncbi:hypothetical protein DUI87_13130 [Hirundo rustica rustica]|uniref:Uncharacterized protein n=1 Tax=Hirundo rustica rustica TaxID=333673 RepID=A0A3M0KB18_HIRRU|nr:hypothetical protein DUI87_13130 [Hirundo rustica rustica]
MDRPLVPQLQNPGGQLPHPRGLLFQVLCWGVGEAPHGCNGKPHYGDVFSTNAAKFQMEEEEEEIDCTPWGQLEPSDGASSEEEEESDEEKPDKTRFITPADSGFMTPGGFSSVPARMETPELIELHKKIKEAMDRSETPPAVHGGP